MNVFNDYIKNLKPMFYALLVFVIAVLVGLFLIWYVISYLVYRKTDYAKVTHKSFIKMRFNTGNYGEYLCYRMLRRFEKAGARFLYNCYLPREKNKTTEIDVLMLHTSGIYVLESKNYSGWIFGSEFSKNWTQTLPSGKKARKEYFYNPVMQNKTHIKWLKKLVGEEVLVHSVIVFSKRCTLKKIDVQDKSLYIIKRDKLVRTVKKIDAASKDVLLASEVIRLYELLYPYSQVDETVKKKHIEEICK